MGTIEKSLSNTASAADIKSDPNRSSLANGLEKIIIKEDAQILVEFDEDQNRERNIQSEYTEHPIILHVTQIEQNPTRRPISNVQ